MNKTEEVVRILFVSLSVTLIMQLGGFADLRQWLIIGGLTIFITLTSLVISHLLGIGAFGANHDTGE